MVSIFHQFIPMKGLWTTSLSLNMSLVFTFRQYFRNISAICWILTTHYDDLDAPIFLHEGCFSTKRPTFFRRWIVTPFGEIYNLQSLVDQSGVERRNAKSFSEEGKWRGNTQKIQHHPNFGLSSANTAPLSSVRYYTNNDYAKATTNFRFPNHFNCSFDPSFSMVGSFYRGGTAAGRTPGVFFCGE